MQPDDELNDSWFDRPGRQLRREDLPTLPAPPSQPPQPAADDEPAERDSLADPWFR